MTSGYWKGQPGGVHSKADNRSEVTKKGHLVAGHVHQEDEKNIFVIKKKKRNKKISRYNLTLKKNTFLLFWIKNTNISLLTQKGLNILWLMMRSAFSNNHQLRLYSSNSSLQEPVWNSSAINHQIYCDTKHSFAQDGDNLIKKLVSCAVCILSSPEAHWLMSEA